MAYAFCGKVYSWLDAPLSDVNVRMKHTDFAVCIIDGGKSMAIHRKAAQRPRSASGRRWTKPRNVGYGQQVTMGMAMESFMLK
jgi:hypothetical protein